MTIPSGGHTQHHLAAAHPGLVNSSVKNTHFIVYKTAGNIIVLTTIMVIVLMLLLIRDRDTPDRLHILNAFPEGVCVTLRLVLKQAVPIHSTSNDIK